MKRTASSLYDRSVGLMFEKTGEIELEIILPKKTRLGASIHTLFMKYPIHVKWLDESKNVIHEAVIKPWQINYTPPKPAKYIIEKKHE